MKRDSSPAAITSRRPLCEPVETVDAVEELIDGVDLPSSLRELESVPASAFAREPNRRRDRDRRDR